LILKGLIWEVPDGCREVPEWLVMGRMVNIPKERKQNYAVKT
jgi:hypothetical protein